MQDKFEKVLSGETKLEDLPEEEQVEFHRELKESSEEELKKYQGVKQARQAEEKKLEDAQAEAKRKEEEAEEERKKKEAQPEPETPPAEEKPKDERFDQFREEQVQKAKDKLFATIEVSDDDKKAIEEKFERLDTGKADADLIYKDLLSAVAAAKPEEYFNAINEKKHLEANAAKFEEQQAGGQPDTNPDRQENKQYSDEVKELSKSAGISLEAAQRQLSEGGMKRVHD